MPTYEYECLECKHRFEMFQSMLDEPVKKCIKCGSSVRKRFGAGAGIIFKGSGFYTTDYKNNSSKSDVKGGSQSEGGSCSSCNADGTC